MARGRKTSTEGRKTFKRTKTQGRGPGDRKAVRAWTKEASRKGGGNPSGCLAGLRPAVYGAGKRPATTY